jgi:glycyl-tRNA synthetase beta chain
MGDKSKRIGALSGYIAGVIGTNVKDSARAGLLCKSDLVTDMVGEFADLQGVMGGYYALNDGENQVLAEAISEHYHPRFSGDSLPNTSAGLAVSIADKLDTIVGVYGIGHKPTGSKDPYALKRASLGLLRMIIESKLSLSISILVSESAKGYSFDINTQEITAFILERLEAYYQEQGIDKVIIKAVLKSQEKRSEMHSSSVYDWHLRVEALNVFMQDGNAKSLIEANKRIKNILKDIKAEEHEIDAFTFKLSLDKATQFDKDLYKDTRHAFAVKNENKDNYQMIIKEFLSLKDVIDVFFDNVMVNDKDLEIRRLRLNLIGWVQTLFLDIADFSYLSK